MRKHLWEVPPNWTGSTTLFQMLEDYAQYLEKRLSQDFDMNIDTRDVIAKIRTLLEIHKPSTP